MKLNDEDFVPKMKVFDDKNYILGLTDVGDALNIYKRDSKEQYYYLLDENNKKIKDIIDKLYNRYGLYHNDLRMKNICIDKYNNILLIDLELCSTTLREGETKYFILN